MRSYKVALIAFCCALPLLMAPSGGFPSRPIVQTVNATSTYGGGTGSTTAFVARSGYPALELRESDAAANNVRWRLGASGEQFFIDALADNGASGGTVLTVERTGTTIDSINLQGTAVQVNGVAIPKMARGVVGGSGSCAINTSWSNAGITGCTSSGTGVYAIDVTAAGFTDEPACTASSRTSALQINEVRSEATTTINVALQTFNASGVATDGQVSLICVGA